MLLDNLDTDGLLRQQQRPSRTTRISRTTRSRTRLTRRTRTTPLQQPISSTWQSDSDMFITTNLPEITKPTIESSTAANVSNLLTNSEVHQMDVSFNYSQNEPVPLDGLNSNYTETGKAFVELYYDSLDDVAKRDDLVKMYHNNLSLVAVEGQLMDGGAFAESLSFENITRWIATIDFQPTHDGAVLVNVLGKTQSNDETEPRSFMEIFIVKPCNESFHIQHQILRRTLF